jgi:hypothetical protein
MSKPAARKIDFDWARQKEALAEDGSLRDIYVLGTTAEDWKRVVTFLKAAPYRAKLEDESLMIFHVGDVEICCHFFVEDQVELDFWPNDVGEPELKALLEFMGDLGDLTGKRVLMTPESDQQNPIFEYEPTKRKVSYRAAK